MEIFEALSDIDDSPDKDLLPRGITGNDERTRGNIHNGENRCPSARPTVSGGVSNNSHDTPSEAARRAKYKHNNSNKSVGPPHARGGRKVKNMTSQSTTDKNRDVGQEGASLVDAHLTQSLLMTSGAHHSAPASRREEQKVHNDVVYCNVPANHRKSNKDLRTNLACDKLGGRKRQTWISGRPKPTCRNASLRTKFYR